MQEQRPNQFVNRRGQLQRHRQKVTQRADDLKGRPETGVDRASQPIEFEEGFPVVASFHPELHCTLLTLVTAYTQRLVKLIEKVILCANKEVRKAHWQIYGDEALQEIIRNDIKVVNMSVLHPRKVSLSKGHLKLDTGGRLLTRI